MISEFISAIFKTKGVIGADIGAHSVKLSRITLSAHKIKAEECGFFPISVPDNASPADRISLISAEMRKFIRKKGIECRNAVILLSGSDVRISYSLLDRMPEENFKAACVKEAGKLFFNNEDLLIDYDSMGEVSEEGVPKVRVAFAAAKKETVSEKVLIAEQSGLEPLMVIPAAFAFEKLFHTLKNRMEGNHLLVNLGREYSQIYLVSSGRTVAVRNVSAGSVSADNEITSLINAGPEVAEEIKKRYSVPVSEEEKRAVLDRFSMEEAAAITAKKRYMSALSAEIDPFVYLSDVNISDILLIGGPAADNGLTVFLEKKLGIPVKPFPFDDLITRKSLKIFGSNAPMFMPASAASVSAGYLPGTTEMNLLPSGYEKYGRGIAITVKIILYVLFAAMAAAIFVINGTKTSLKQAIREKNASWAAAAVQASAPEIEALRQEAEVLEKYVSQAEGIRQKRTFSLGLISDLTETMPQEAYISSLNVQPGEEDSVMVEIKAAAKDSREASQWMEALSKKSGYSNFTAGHAAQDSSSDNTFVLPASFEYKGGAK